MNKLQLYGLYLKIKLMRYLADTFHDWSVKLYAQLDFINLGLVRKHQVDENGDASVVVCDIVDIKSKWKDLHVRSNEHAKFYRPQNNFVTHEDKV